MCSIENARFIAKISVCGKWVAIIYIYTIPKIPFDENGSTTSRQAVYGAATANSN